MRAWSPALKLSLLCALASLGARAGHGRPPPASYVNLQTLTLSPTLPKAAGVRSAMKLVYMMGDDQIIWEAGKQTLETMTSFPPMKSLAYSLAFVDQPAKGASLWYFGDDPAAPPAISPLAPGVTKVPGNSMQLMTKVLQWAVQSYPSSYRYIDFESHGGGAFGIGTDDGENPYGLSKRKLKMMPIQGLARALRDGSGGKPFDLVFFNACMMSNIEALYEIEPSVRYAVGSMRSISPYTKTTITDLPMLLEKMARSGEKPEQVARALAKAAMAKDASGIESVTAIELRKLQPLVRQINALVAALLKSPQDLANLKGWLDDARDDGAGMNRPMGDLWLFARRVQLGATDPAVLAAAKGLFRLQAGATLYEKGDGKHTGGLSIYMPTQYEGSLLALGYRQTRFAKETGWDQLMRVALAVKKP
jgi:hypothetical protein